jgi:hypothetical protein
MGRSMARQKVIEEGRKEQSSITSCLRIGAYLSVTATGVETMKIREDLAQIACKHLGIATLETQNSDSADFHEVAVWSLSAALLAAFEAGRAVEKAEK